MSYILEALKKAEAERHAEAAHPARLAAVLGATRTPAREGARQRRVAPAALALLVVVAGAAWYAYDGAATRATQTKAEEQHAMPAPLAAIPAAPVAATPAPPPATQDLPSEPTARPKEKPAKKVPQKRPPATQEAHDGAANASAANVPALPALHELPDQVRREIPAYSVGGYIYSGNRADRSILINTRLLREGDEIAPGLMLEKMMPKEMVLNYKGYRYRAPY